MNRKMDLLEMAHGLLCNVPGDGGSAEDGEHWHKLRTEWIERWTHVIRDHATKHANKRVHVGNEAITEYQRNVALVERVVEAVDRAGNHEGVPAAFAGSPDRVANWRVIGCPDHGVYAVDLNGLSQMCGTCVVVGPDGKPLGANDGRDEESAA